MQRSRGVLGRLAAYGKESRIGSRFMSSEGHPHAPEQQPGINPDEPPPPPPNVFAAVGAMGAGALGAVLIAAVGVYGVFKMALYVASETGRTLNADKPAPQAEGAAASAAVQQQQQQQSAAAGGNVKAASALERKWTDAQLWRKWQGGAAASLAAAPATPAPAAAHGGGS